jgi:hypothetical protein
MELLMPEGVVAAATLTGLAVLVAVVVVARARRGHHSEFPLLREQPTGAVGEVETLTAVQRAALAS